MKTIILSVFNSSTPPNNTPFFSFSLYHTLLLAFSWLIYFVHFPPFCMLVSVFWSCCRFYMNNIMTATAQDTIPEHVHFCHLSFLEGSAWTLRAAGEYCLKNTSWHFCMLPFSPRLMGILFLFFFYVSWRSHKQQSQHIQEKLPSKI